MKTFLIKTEDNSVHRHTCLNDGTETFETIGQIFYPTSGEPFFFVEGRDKSWSLREIIQLTEWMMD